MADKEAPVSNFGHHGKKKDDGDDTNSFDMLDEFEKGPQQVDSLSSSDKDDTARDEEASVKDATGNLTDTNKFSSDLRVHFKSSLPNKEPIVEKSTEARDEDDDTSSERDDDVQAEGKDDASIPEFTTDEDGAVLNDEVPNNEVKVQEPVQKLTESKDGAVLNGEDTNDEDKVEKPVSEPTEHKDGVGLDGGVTDHEEKVEESVPKLTKIEHDAASDHEYAHVHDKGNDTAYNRAKTDDVTMNALASETNKADVNSTTEPSRHQPVGCLRKSLFEPKKGTRKVVQTSSTIASTRRLTKSAAAHRESANRELDQLVDHLEKRAFAPLNVFDTKIYWKPEYGIEADEGYGGSNAFPDRERLWWDASTKRLSSYVQQFEAYKSHTSKTTPSIPTIISHLYATAEMIQSMLNPNGYALFDPTAYSLIHVTYNIESLRGSELSLHFVDTLRERLEGVLEVEHTSNVNFGRQATKPRLCIRLVHTNSIPSIHIYKKDLHNENKEIKYGEIAYNFSITPSEESGWDVQNKISMELPIASKQQYHIISAFSLPKEEFVKRLFQERGRATLKKKLLGKQHYKKMSDDIFLLQMFVYVLLETSCTSRSDVIKGNMREFLRLLDPGLVADFFSKTMYGLHEELIMFCVQQCFDAMVRQTGWSGPQKSPGVLEVLSDIVGQEFTDDVLDAVFDNDIRPDVIEDVVPNCLSIGEMHTMGEDEFSSDDEDGSDKEEDAHVKDEEASEEEF